MPEVLSMWTLSLLFGTQTIQDDRFWRISYADVLLGVGARAEWSPQRNLALVLDWQAGGSATELVPLDSSDTGLSGPNVNVAHRFQRVGFGARGQITLEEFMQPYVVAQGLLQIDTLRLDDDPDHDDNATQLRARGAGLGVHAAAGVAFMVETDFPRLLVVPYIEAGYGHIFEHQVGELGGLAFHGISGRLGIGARF